MLLCKLVNNVTFDMEKVCTLVSKRIMILGKNKQSKSLMNKYFDIVMKLHFIYMYTQK